MLWNKAAFCLEVLIYKRLQMWRHNDVIDRNEYVIYNFYIVGMYRSLGIFTAIFASIHTSFMDIWKKMWVGVFFWTQCNYS